MFKQTYLASAILLALASQATYAAEAEATQSPQAEETAQPSSGGKAQNNEEMEIIQVQGIRGSLNKAVELKRQNIQVVDAIIAEDIGKFPDNNVVEALQRVTGVQVTDRASGEANTVSIRGLTDVTTTVNGRQVFTAAGREVAIADVPAALLGSVEVFKTRSSSQVASGIAGQIDIRTHRPFDFQEEKISVAAKGIYSDQPDTIDPNFSALISDRWDTSIGEVGALVNVSYIRTNYNDQVVAPGASMPYYAETGVQIPDAYWKRGLAHGLDTSEGALINGQEYLLMRDAVFQNMNNGERERPALNLSLQWAPTDTSEYLFEAFYNGYRNDNFNSMLFSNVDSSANWSQVIQEGIEVYDGTNVVKSRTSYNVDGFSSSDHSHNKTDSYVFALGGKWDFDNLTLKSEVVYQTSTYESQFLAMRGVSANSTKTFYGVDVDYNDKSGGVPSWVYLDNPDTDINESDLTQYALWQTAQLYDSGAKDEGDSVTWTFDGDYFLDYGIFTKMKFGVRAEQRGAKHGLYDAGSLNTNVLFSDLDPNMFTVTSGFFDGRANVPTSWAIADGNYLYANRSAIEAMYNADEQALAMYTNYDITEKSYAAYIQSDFETELWGKQVDGQIGLRYEKADADMDFWERKKYAEEDVVDDIRYYLVHDTDTNGSAELLPSLMVRFWLTDDLVARFAYTETIRRPAFGDLTTAISYTEDLTKLGFGQASSGNSKLEPTTSQNYDFSLEYYFGEGSSIFGTYFRRDIEGFVFNSSSTITREVDGETKKYILSRPENASNGKLTGYELGAVYFLENMPSYLDGLGTQVSATFLDSSQDIPEFDSESGEQIGTTTRELFGVSDTSMSAVLIYDKDDYSARLSYTWRDKFLSAYDAGSFAMPRGIYRKPEQSLDFQFSYNISDEFVLTFDATNILDDVYQEYYEDSVLYNRTNSIYTRTFALGARYSF
ncbi:TonB-dependent receptor [Shewanella xiamenensis]|uniref:TonB-dependent receptor n=1 Tax=Shewanella xiamenensis TaxID=332186 RepID=UPI001C4DFE7D|nr:TonB-dependent receptor [Shewanella xiamenensis]MBW0298109.1 TonB-dependent receptor [Shewanella xiamenensis]